MRRIRVNEIFETVQGEAAYTGTPAVFVRLQGCPVGCPWCDTKHTWDTNPQDEVGIDAMLQKAGDSPQWAAMTEEEIAEAVESHRANHVVVTGGEPALYDLTALSALLIDRGFTFQVETSGTHRLAVDPRAWVTVSPKIDMPGGFDVLPEMLERANEIKHPVGKQRHVDELVDLLGDRPRTVVWLQPLSQSPAATKTCTQQATERGWRISVQVHKYLGVR